MSIYTEKSKRNPREFGSFKETQPLLDLKSFLDLVSSFFFDKDFDLDLGFLISWTPLHVIRSMYALYTRSWAHRQPKSWTNSARTDFPGLTGKAPYLVVSAAMMHYSNLLLQCSFP